MAYIKMYIDINIIYFNHLFHDKPGSAEAQW